MFHPVIEKTVKNLGPIGFGRPENPQFGDMWFEPLDSLMNRPSCDDYTGAKYAVAWKKDDSHYPDVVESIETRGFVRPLIMYPNDPQIVDNGGTLDDEDLRMGDGHHRLGAAEDLGMQFVPVVLGRGMGISADSGYWEEGQPIRTDAYLDGNYQQGCNYDDQCGEDDCDVCGW